MIFRYSSALLALACLAGCGTVQPDGKLEGDPAPSSVSPSEALGMARELSEHAWRPFATNILHGKDRSGVLVNTPDAGFKDDAGRPGWWVPGEANRGVPYKWGGFDDPASFDAAVANGAAAGDVSSDEKRRLDQAGVSAQAAGVDCSGFVSRCLKLPTVHDTTQLPSICKPLRSHSDLRPGDLLNISKGHVLLCAGWATPDRQWIYYYDTGGAPTYWRPSLKSSPIRALLALGYRPLRYRGMSADKRVEGKQVLSRGARGAVEIVAEPEVGAR